MYRVRVRRPSRRHMHLRPVITSTWTTTQRSQPQEFLETVRQVLKAQFSGLNGFFLGTSLASIFALVTFMTAHYWPDNFEGADSNNVVCSPPAAGLRLLVKIDDGDQTLRSIEKERCDAQRPCRCEYAQGPVKHIRIGPKRHVHCVWLDPPDFNAPMAPPDPNGFDVFLGEDEVPIAKPSPPAHSGPVTM